MTENGYLDKAVLPIKISKDNSDHLLSQTIKQIQKDFALYGYSINYSGKVEDAYEQICNQIKSIVEDVLEKGTNGLLDILYRIDVSEKKVKENIVDHPEVPAPKIISRLILEREFKKVITRESYGSE